MAGLALLIVRRFLPAKVEPPSAEKPAQPSPQTIVVKVEAPAAKARPAPTRGRFQAPSPPETFTGHTRELADLSQRLLAAADPATGVGPSVAISAAVQGMGGGGKTALAQKLGQELAGHFPAGVLWLSIGYGATRGNAIDRAAVDCRPVGSLRQAVSNRYSN